MKNPIRIFASTFGTIMALAGLEHGIGEFLQGKVAPAGLVFPSWPEAAFFRNLGGEPALSILPNLRITGILAVLISLALLAWSLFFVQRKHGGLGMMLLSAALLLFGGGIFPPVFGLLTGAIATRIHAPLRWWRVHLSNGIRAFLAALRPWALAACVLGFLTLTPGMGLLGYFFGLDSVLFILAVGGFVLVALGLTVISSFAAAA